jgi:hypothetical protein
MVILKGAPPSASLHEQATQREEWLKKSLRMVDSRLCPMYDSWGVGVGVKESNKTTAKRLDYFLFEKKRNPGKRPNPKKNMVDYNLTLCPFQSRLQHIYLGQPYARVDPKPTVCWS